jgi:hypothetical protein
VRRYRFRALVKFDSVAREDCAPGSPSRTGVLTKYACCLLQPFYCGEYFPAVISGDLDLPPPQPGGHAVVTIALADGEAEACFAPGQGFTVWADGVAGRMIRADGMIGYGVICGPESALVTAGDGGRRGSMPARRAAALIRHLPGHGACGYGS